MLVSPPVSNVGVPEYELGTHAVELLAAQLDDAAASRETWLPASLTVRDGEEAINSGAGDGGGAS
jgi:DNA-binding LacI/PurR family transcriptional regulator